MIDNPLISVKKMMTFQQNYHHIHLSQMWKYGRKDIQFLFLKPEEFLSKFINVKQ